MLLSLSALPALAQQAPGLAGDRAELPAPPERSLLPEAMSLSDRALLLATDLNRLLLPAARLPAEPAQDGDGKVRKVLQNALTLLGTPYRWGGNSPDSGFDCSGLVRYVFRSALGIELPRVSREMANTGTPITDRAALAAGDLVFFGRKGKVDHVGIYLGDGRFVHAPRTGRDVTVSSLETGYWAGKFLSARRVEGI
ncbi:hypothetical protein GCM10007167_07480 [Vulcaniibacterium thermophilum]|uniref:NlpC/P60 domain-containing protein n=1 Tax=Vulcaniibacterium thermophilum TaxID=1169913 RepID=A0A919DAH8_9GAMM|nr:hypothetical protein GCM10007167_07480 [Vulcaniibacterium thermophilum]